MACRELVPDVWSLARYVQEAMDELKAAVAADADAPPPKRKTGAKKPKATAEGG
jgi:hypothetical protein